MATRFTINQLEKMKTHDLADLLANVVSVLRRMPNVECNQLFQQVPDIQNGNQSPFERPPLSPKTYTREELVKKTKDELKAIAKERNVLFSSSIKKDDLIQRILAKSADGHSEQRTIQDIL